MAKYKKYARPFLPIRFLNLLPLSHMFGQAMATFVPPMLPGVVVFTRSFAPEDIVSQIRTRRISVLVSVPKILEVLKEHVLRIAPEAADDPGKIHWMRRWWKFRRIHRLFGFKFWAMVVGAAPLDPELEAFWGRLGFLVVQGYGLTETAPIVTLNHPFHASRGAVGKPIAGVEVRIAEDGEILVRGENVTSGYYNAPEETRASFKDGWFHTGDIGELDASGQLHIRGRKKEMIVTPEGLNVFPEDVERVLNDLPGVIESAVIGAPLPGSSAERVQAVIAAAPGTDLDEVVRQANARLQDHQKVRAAVAWTGGELPRTEGTRKLKRRELRQWITGNRERATSLTTGGHNASGATVASVISRFAPGRTIQSSTTLDELGLSSLERVELMMALEESLECTDRRVEVCCRHHRRRLEELTRPLEGQGAATVHAATRGHRLSVLESFRSDTRAATGQPADVDLAARARLRKTRSSRAGTPAEDHRGRSSLPPIIKATWTRRRSSMALPARWRYRVAPAMAKEFFKAHFFPEQFGRSAWFTNSLNYYLASRVLQRVSAAAARNGNAADAALHRRSLRGGILTSHLSRGKRTDNGEINRFQPGVGMIASPARCSGCAGQTRRARPCAPSVWKFPRRGPASVTFGPPMSLKGNDYAEITREVEDAVRNSNG